MNKGVTTWVAWFALILGVVAFLLSLSAIVKTNPASKNSTSEIKRILNLELAKRDAAGELAILRAEQERQRNFTELGEQIQDTRGELEDAYKAAGEDTSDDWQALRRQFDNLQEQIKKRDANTLTSLISLLADLRQRTLQGE